MDTWFGVITLRSPLGQGFIRTAIAFNAYDKAIARIRNAHALSTLPIMLVVRSRKKTFSEVSLVSLRRHLALL